MALYALLIVSVVLLVVGCPIYASFLGGALAYFLLNGKIAMTMLPQRMVVAMDSFTFLAIPFFMLAGQIMNRGGITKRIFHFADTLVGRFRGGLGYVNILSSFIFAGMSGSALADIGGLGVVEMQAMKEAGYEEDFSIGVTAASSTIGPIVPPSLPFVQYSLFSNTSLGSLFLAGFTPGIALVITLSVMTYLVATKKKYPKGERYPAKEIMRAFSKSFWALLSPIILMSSIWGGFVTPTEAAFLCIIYSLLVGCFIYKDIKFQDIKIIVREAFDAIAPILPIVMVACVFGFIFNYEGMNKKVATFFMGITESKYVFLLIVNIFLILVGMVLDSSASLVVLVPILAPIAAMYGINLTHFGVIFCMNIMIGLLTPPVGTSLYLLTKVMHRSFKEIVHAVSPWLIPLFVALFICTYWEGFVMFLPRMFGMR